MRRAAERLLRFPAMKIEINAGSQELLLRDGHRILKRYTVSTSKNGLGEKNGSFCTPRGSRIARATIGAGQRDNSVFVRRRPSGEIWTPQLRARYPGRDWILTRILWLAGCEPEDAGQNPVPAWILRVQ